MARNKSSAGWVAVVSLLVLNGALFGAVSYLKHHNPAYWVTISDDFGKILLAEQYPNRLEANAVAYKDIVGVELKGTSSFMDPGAAEVYVTKKGGQKIRVHYSSRGADDHAKNLAERLELPLQVVDFESPYAAESQKDAPSLGNGAAPPTLPDAR